MYSMHICDILLFSILFDLTFPQAQGSTVLISVRQHQNQNKTTFIFSLCEHSYIPAGVRVSPPEDPVPSGSSGILRVWQRWDYVTGRRKTADVNGLVLRPTHPPTHPPARQLRETAAGNRLSVPRTHGPSGPVCSFCLDFENIYIYLTFD